MNYNLNTLKPTKYLFNVKTGSVDLGEVNPSGDWAKYFGQYEGQKHDDLDSNCCWSYSGNEVLEDQLEFLMKEGYFSSDDIKWFQDNGYIDEDGDFYLSRRWIPTLSGVKRNGNDQHNFWLLTLVYGAIPNKLLPYTNNIDYFDTAFITDGMKALGKEFLKRVDIDPRELGSRWTRRSVDDIKSALKKTELQIGVPVPRNVSVWNSGNVKWDGGLQANHSVALYKYDDINFPDFPYRIYDQYNPMLKGLSKDYFIPLIEMVIMRPKNPMIGPKLELTLLIKLVRFLQSIGVIINAKVQGIIK